MYSSQLRSLNFTFIPQQIISEVGESNFTQSDENSQAQGYKVLMYVTIMPNIYVCTHRSIDCCLLYSWSVSKHLSPSGCGRVAGVPEETRVFQRGAPQADNPHRPAGQQSEAPVTGVSCQHISPSFSPALWRI